MSSSLHEILWKNKAEEPPSSTAQLQDNEDIQLKEQETQEDAA